MGITTVCITALPTIAQMVGANRILRGVAITHPTGDPSLAAGDELAMRDADARPRARDARDRRRAADRLGGRGVSRRPAIIARRADAAARARPGAARLEAHARARARCRACSRRSAAFDEASAYPPHQVVHREPHAGVAPRPAAAVVARRAAGASAVGPHGEIVDQRALYDLLAELDRFELVRMGAGAAPGRPPAVPRRRAVRRVRARPRGRRVAQRRTSCSRTSSCLAGAVHATRFLLADDRRRPRRRSRTSSTAARRRSATATSAAGGNLAKAVAEATRAHRGERRRHQGVLRRARPRADRRRRAGARPGSTIGSPSSPAARSRSSG